MSLWVLIKSTGGKETINLNIENEFYVADP